MSLALRREHEVSKNTRFCFSIVYFLLAILYKLFQCMDADVLNNLKLHLLGMRYICIRKYIHEEIFLFLHYLNRMINSKVTCSAININNVLTSFSYHIYHLFYLCCCTLLSITYIFRVLFLHHNQSRYTIILTI